MQMETENIVDFKKCLVYDRKQSLNDQEIRGN